MSRVIFDADGHVMENPNEIISFLPKPYKGNRSLLGFPLWPTLDGWNRAANRIYDGKKRTIVEPNVHEWSKFMDLAGIETVVLYPTQGLSHGLISDRVWGVALAIGYNNWLAGKFLAVYPRRLKGAALLPLQNIPAACSELERAVGIGMVGGILTAVNSSSLPLLGEKYYFPLYKKAQELNCMLGVHGAPASGLWLEGLTDFTAVRALSHATAQMHQCTSMIFGGVFEHFPELRVGFLEGGIGWVPFLLERLDAEYAKRKARISSSPSDQIKKGQAFFHCELDERLILPAIEIIGDNQLISASDFPHEPAREYHGGLHVFEERKDIGAEVRQKILGTNAKRLYNL